MKISPIKHYSLSEIHPSKNGNTYVGENANKLIGLWDEISKSGICDNSRFTVLEIMPDGKVVARAIQSRFMDAVSYMNPDRVLVYPQ